MGETDSVIPAVGVGCVVGGNDVYVGIGVKTAVKKAVGKGVFVGTSVVVDVTVGVAIDVQEAKIMAKSVNVKI